LESGLFPLALIEVNPYSLIQEIKSVFQSQAENKNISITLNDSDNIPNIKCEKRKIHQVLSNLVDNSLKFTPDAGHIQISVALAGNSVLFEVSDSGLGIPQEDQPHVFERFYRVDSSREHKGTGLGLSIAKHIIEAHGGTITLTSSEGHGSNFAFTIPI
jgi:signal transduction histidine kinase